MSDSRTIFAEGTFQEQIQELVNYIVRNRSEEERSAFIRPFQDVLKTEEGQELGETKRKDALSMVIKEVKGFGDGSEKEIIGFFNLLFAHLFTLYPIESDETKTHLTALLQTIESTHIDEISTKYRLLSNVFNALPKQSPLRLQVYQTILKVATNRDELGTLDLTRQQVETWLSEWNISPEEKSMFWKSVYDAFAHAAQDNRSYEFYLSYVSSLPPNSTEAKSSAVELIATALRLPNVFDFDPLFKLDAVVAQKDHELFSLLQIFLGGGLAEFNAWVEKNNGILEKNKLDKNQLEYKIRLLTFATLGFKNVGRELPYAAIASALEVDPLQVEKWSINVIRAGLLSGKLSQTTQTLHVTRATARTFEREQWEVLENRLVSWRSGLNDVLEVVTTARRRNEQSQGNQH